jgi:hypothetical protein
MVSHCLVCQTTEVFLELNVICERSQLCSTVLIINGPDQSFEYIACGLEARTDRLFPLPIAAETTNSIEPNNVSYTSSSCFS